MKTMISYQEIIQKIKNKENQYLTSIIEGKDFFPFSIPCDKKESGDYLSDAALYKELGKKSKNMIGKGYRIITNRDENPNIKTSTKIKQIIIDSEDDFLYLIGKEHEGSEFKNTIQKFRSHFDSETVDRYLLKNKKSLFKSDSSFVDNFIELSVFLVSNPSSMMYPREIPVRCDTKFLEKNLTAFKTFISYFRDIDKSADKWQQLGLVNPEYTVSLRSGDSFIVKTSQSNFRCPILSVEPSILGALEGHFDKVFILENKTTFYTFPLKEKEIAIYCGGFGILILKNIPFLKSSPVYYFGDIDEHGFAILSKFRELYNDVKSICMDMDTIKEYESNLIEGESYPGEIEMLVEDEIEALNYIRDHKINGCSSRIEQEKISQSFIEERLQRLD
jgi:hypothetical protein